MNTASKPEPEHHLFLLWHNGQNHKDQVLKEIKNRGLVTVSIHEGHWPKRLFKDNLRVFYGLDDTEIRRKIKETGIGDFSIIIVLDEAPNYDFRETTRGFQFLNTNVFELKSTLRQKIFKKNFLHGTNSLIEAQRDFFLIFGAPLEDVISDATKAPREQLFGVGGWTSVAEILTVLNNCDEYIVMRNFEELPDKLSLTGHGDIDILTTSWRYTKNLLSARRVFPQSYRRHFILKMRDGSKIPIDIRSVGDGYYDRNWQARMLKDRVLQNGLYIPSKTHHRASLIYHALLQKAHLAPDYTLALNTNDAGQSTGSWMDNFSELHAFMRDHEYTYSLPDDKTVGFDTRFLPNSLADQIENIEHLGLTNVQPFRVDLWKNQFKSSYFLATATDGMEVFVKCGGVRGSARREYKLLTVLQKRLAGAVPKPVSYSDDDRNILVIEYLKGSNLTQVLEQGPLRVDEATALKNALRRILDVLLSERIIHRDIRPDNLIVNDAGNVAVIDFQFALSQGSVRFKEYRQIKKRLKQLKNLGSGFSLGRYGWDDAYSVDKIMRLIDENTFPAPIAPAPALESIGTYRWYGKRNTKLDFLRYWFVNKSRALLRKHTA